MGARGRLDKLNQVHGIHGNIHQYNLYYKVDWLRITTDEFGALLGCITAHDVLRVRLLAESTDNDATQALQLVA